MQVRTGGELIVARAAFLGEWAQETEGMGCVQRRAGMSAHRTLVRQTWYEDVRSQRHFLN